MIHRFGDRLRELRLEGQYRQSDLERLLNLRKGVVSQYERGLREPGFDLLLSLAERFGVSVDYLLGRPDAIRRWPLDGPEGSRPLPGRKPNE